MNEKGYNECVDTLSIPLFKFLWRQMKVKEEAENIVQDSFEQLWIYREKVDLDKAKSWLFTTGYRRMIDFLRREKKWNEMPEQVTESGFDNKYNHSKETILNAIDKLPEIQKSLILLRDLEGYDYQEIGNITNLSESQVKVYLFRARQTLKNYFVKIENVI